MVNFGFNSASILGIFLAVAGAGLYFLRSFRPELSRDHDIFFSVVGLVCGFILIFQGWRLDPILQLGQLLLTGATIFFAVESIRLRGVATEQARRNTPIVDDRPVSKVYNAVVDDYYPEEGDRNVRRLKGSDPRNRDRDEYYEEENPRRTTTRRTSVDRTPESDRPSKKRPTRTTTRSSSNYDDWSNQDDWDDRPKSRTSNRSENWDDSDYPERPTRESRTQTPLNLDDPTPKRRKKRPTDDNSPTRSNREDIPSEYVDYQPIDPTET